MSRTGSMPRRPRSVESSRAEPAASRFLTAAPAVEGIGAVTLATRDLASAVRSYHAIGSSDPPPTPSCPSLAALAGGARAPYCFEGL